MYRPAQVAYSSDGAQTFTFADLPPVRGSGNGGDVSTTFDNKGKHYLSSLHFDKLSSGSHGETNFAWTDTPFVSEQAFLGDSTWLAAFNNKVYGVWTETAAPQEAPAAKPPLAGKSPREPRSGREQLIFPGENEIRPVSGFFAATHP